MPRDVLNLKIVGCDNVGALDAFLCSSGRVLRGVFEHTSISHAKDCGGWSCENERSSDGCRGFDASHGAYANCEVMDAQLLLGRIGEAI
jgi:hypothetical protein